MEAVQGLPLPPSHLGTESERVNACLQRTPSNTPSSSNWEVKSWKKNFKIEIEGKDSQEIKPECVRSRWNMLKMMGKKTFRAILEILSSPPQPIMGENVIWAKFTFNDILIMVMIINFICHFQAFLYSTLQHIFLAQLKIKSLSLPYRKSKL